MTTTSPALTTAAVPFAFRDVATHTLTVWAAFTILSVAYGSVVYWEGLGDTSSFGLLASIAVGFAATAFVLTRLGAPLAWLLGRALRRVHRRWLHFVAFGLLGFAAGLAVAFALVVGGPIAESTPLFAGILATVCGGCTAFGRWVAYRLRQRRDARRSH